MAGCEKLRKAESLYRDMEYRINSWQPSRWARGDRLRKWLRILDMACEIAHTPETKHRFHIPEIADCSCGATQGDAGARDPVGPASAHRTEATAR
jgi:hypothetical protein